MIRNAWTKIRAGLIALGTVLGVINTFALLTLTYIFIIGPIALVFRLWRHDPLSRSRSGASSYWRSKEETAVDEKTAMRQF